MDSLSLVLHAGAVVAIVFAWYKVTALRRRIPGGLVKATCNLLGEFIGLFALVCLALSFSSVLPEGSREMLVGIVLVFAAAFSITVINFFSSLADESGF
jgi:hypothetical protein